jgi:hypothetical protein
MERTCLADFHGPNRRHTHRLAVVRSNYVLPSFPSEFLAFVEHAHDQNTALMAERSAEGRPRVDRLGAPVDVARPLIPIWRWF